MSVMVDSCVYLDVFTRDERWFEWSYRKLAGAANTGKIVVNPVIYAEISVRFAKIEPLETYLTPDIFEYRPIPREAAFLAGKCFMKYRGRGGLKSAPLPDFFIGAHAAIEKLPLITRDPKRFREHFPSLRLIQP
jgi:predicted nucleic acid-binding protein